MEKAAVVDRSPRSENPGQEEPAVRVRGLTKSYGRERAVAGVDLDAHRGRILGLIGPDGAGKSSLLRCVSGVLQYDGGETTVLGTKIDSARAAEAVKARLGWMSQGLGNNLYRELSVEENIDFSARLRSLPWAELRERKQHLLDVTRLTDFKGRAIKHLSGGMKQKVALICTVIHFPELLILDEPTTGVDPVSRRDFWSTLTQLVAERSMTAVISTAYLDEASYFDRLALLVDGRILQQGGRDQVLAEIDELKVGVRTQHQLPALERLKEQFSHVAIMGTEIHVLVETDSPSEAERRVEESLAGIEVQEVLSLPIDLEDVLVTLMHRRVPPAAPGEGETEERQPPREPQGWGARLLRLVSRRRGAPPAASADLAELIGERSDVPPRTEEEAAVEARGLVCQFGDFRAVDDVSFSIPPGEIFGLLGPNGAGKTTVIKMLTGLLSPTAGGGSVAGADIHGVPLEVKQRIGYMAQTFSLYPDLTVRENIELYANVYRVPRHDLRGRCRWVVELAGLAGMEHKRTDALPMGARQRMALGCALVHRPQVVFLDEPTSGVDPPGRRQFWEILVRLARQWQVAILVTTHYMGEAEHCDHLGLMHEGALIARGSPAELRQELEARAGAPLLVETDDPVRALTALQEAGYSDAVLQGRSARLLSRDHQHDEQRIRRELESAGADVVQVRSGSVTVQDVFVHHVTAPHEESPSRESASPR